MQRTLNSSDFMQQHFLLTKDFETKFDRLMRLNSLAQKTTTVISSIPGGQPDPHSRENIAADIADLSEEIKRDIIALIRKEKEMAAIIMTVDDDRSRVILEKRCLLHKSWETIADEMELSERHAYRIKQEAEEELQKILNMSVNVM